MLSKYMDSCEANKDGQTSVGWKLYEELNMFTLKGGQKAVWQHNYTLKIPQEW